MPSPNDPLRTIEEVAEQYRKPVNTLRYWRQQGIGPKSARLGRQVVYRQSDVDAYLEAQFNQPGPTAS